jgi:hypothetical protein
MIAPICFTKNWLDTVKQVHPNWQINPPLLEKMLYALSLVELLAQYRRARIDLSNQYAR